MCESSFGSSRVLSLIFVLALCGLNTLGLDVIQAQDLTPPQVTLDRYYIEPNGKRYDFLFYVAASDDSAVTSLEFRVRVDGQDFSPWQEYPYIPGFPIYFDVNCSLFVFEVRSLDSSGNRSSSIIRSFRKPFASTAGVPLVDGVPIVEPPTVLAQGGTLTVIMQKFALPKQSRIQASMSTPNLPTLAAKKRKRQIQYEVVLTNAGTQETRRILGKRNVLSVRSVAPGTYSVAYKARVLEGKTSKVETGVSPSRSFSIE